jgi:hypothetical protein
MQHAKDAEFFDRSDFHDFYTIKSIWVGDLGLWGKFLEQKFKISLLTLANGLKSYKKLLYGQTQKNVVLKMNL